LMGSGFLSSARCPYHSGSAVFDKLLIKAVSFNPAVT
jgi:hypothetical protein